MAANKKKITGFLMWTIRNDFEVNHMILFVKVFIGMGIFLAIRRLNCLIIFMIMSHQML